MWESGFFIWEDKFLKWGECEGWSFLIYFLNGFLKTNLDDMMMKSWVLKCNNGKKMSFWYEVKVRKKMKNVGSYYTLLSVFLNAYLGEVITMEEGKDDKFLIQVSFFFQMVSHGLIKMGHTVGTKRWGWLKIFFFKWYQIYLPECQVSLTPTGLLIMVRT